MQQAGEPGIPGAYFVLPPHQQKGTLEVLAGPAKPRPPQSFPMTKTAFAVSSGKDKKNTLYYFGLAKDLKFWCLFLQIGRAHV